jgi:plastocyanin
MRKKTRPTKKSLPKLEESASAVMTPQPSSSPRLGIVLNILIGILAVSAFVLGQKVLFSRFGVPIGIKSTAETNFEERKVLVTPGINATAEERDQYSVLVNKYAKETKTIKIKECEASPLVAKVKNNSEFNFENLDTIHHNIVFNPTHTYLMDSREKVTVKAEFEYGSGIYTYGCDQSTGPIGVIVVSE